MRYGHRCEEHGEFDDNRSMSEAGNAVPCPSCGVVCPRFYGYQKMNIFIPEYFATSQYHVIPRLSDFENRTDYLKATENLAPFKGADKHVLGQDPEQKKEADAIIAEQRVMMRDPAVVAALEQDRAETLAA